MKKWLWILVLNLSACSTHQPMHGTAIDDMATELHEGLRDNKKIPNGHVGANGRFISQVLMPDFKVRPMHRMNDSQRRFDISVKNMPAATFYMNLVKGLSIGIVVSPEIKGSITLHLKHVTVEQVLQVLENTYHYMYNPIPGGYEILPNTVQTKIYNINYLELQRSGNSEMRLHSGEVNQNAPNGGGGPNSGLNSPSQNSSIPTATPGEIGRVRTENKFDFWKELGITLEHMVGKGHQHSVTVNPLAGVVIVRALPKELKQVDAYLDAVQLGINRQVILEAKILEVTLSDTYQMGIDWQEFARKAQAIPVPLAPVTDPYINGTLKPNIKLNSIGDFPSTTITAVDLLPGYGGTIRWAGDFITTIRLLGTQGNVQVLSSPRVSAMNNQQSLIKVGNDEFFVSAIAAGQASGLAVAQPVDVISPFFAGITLDVTPQIDRNGDVTLHIHPAVSSISSQTKLLHAGGSNPSPTVLAKSTVRESDTVVHTKNGQIVIIGGLIQNQTQEDIAELPFFGKIPFLGTLFRATKQTSQKSELVILIKATVMNKDTINRDLKDRTDRIRALRRGFHIGGRPELFGTEGEEPVALGPKAGTHHPLHPVRRHQRCRPGVPGCVRSQRLADPRLQEK